MLIFTSEERTLTSLSQPGRVIGVISCLGGEETEIHELVGLLCLNHNGGKNFTYRLK